MQPIDDLVWRLVLVAVVGVAAAGLGWWSRRGVVLWRRRRYVPLEPGLYLFVSAGCPPCRVMQDRLETLGVDFQLVAYEERPDWFRTHRIDRVPALIGVGSDGRAWGSEGIPPMWLLRRWVSG
ncbi:MAG: hypothetical protein KatS3mg011_1094 [Acidimicrobiia bacterium]|nr:MAG: hypothetical protein KatS3mg011_1094 [Acidimicrobiia bacterium]